MTVWIKKDQVLEQLKTKARMQQVLDGFNLSLCGLASDIDSGLMQYDKEALQLLNQELLSIANRAALVLDGKVQGTGTVWECN